MTITRMNIYYKNKKGEMEHMLTLKQMLGLFLGYVILNFLMWVWGQFTGIEPVQGLLSLIVIGVAAIAVELVQISDKLKIGKDREKQEQS